MIFPMIHLNGTSLDELDKLNTKAWTAVEAALDAVQAAAPHGRDYYAQGEAAYPKAAAEHQARLRQLNAVADELKELVAHLRSVRGRS